jgi:low temperature requirement protein LtrA
MAKRKFWQKPSLHFEEEQNEHRKVTWLELFFDLYFVVVIAALAHNLSANISIHGFMQFVLTFIPVWWIWIGITYYNERFETEGFENRLFTFLLMIPIAGLAIFSHDALGHNLKGFVLSYAIARLITVLMWIYATYHNPVFKGSGNNLIIGFSISIALCFLAAFFSHTLGMIIFGLAMFVDLVTPFFTIKSNRSLPKFSTSKLPERFGLFIIIVLGEGIIGTINGFSNSDHISPGIMYFGILGIAITFALWWIYFDFVGRRTADNTNPIKQFAWAYTHLPLVVCFVAVGASMTSLVNEQGDLALPAKNLLIVATGFAIIMIGVIETVLKKTDNEPMHPLKSPLLKAISGLAILSLYFVIEYVSSKLLMISILIILSINMMYGLYNWFSQEIEDDPIES